MLLMATFYFAKVISYFRLCQKFANIFQSEQLKFYYLHDPYFEELQTIGKLSLSKHCFDKQTGHVNVNILQYSCVI